MTATLTTVEQLATVAETLMQTHYRELPDASFRSAGYNMKVHQAPRVPAGVTAEGLFDGLRGSVSLYLDDDGSVALVMRTVPSFAGYTTTLLPEDVTAERILRHAEHGARRMRQTITERHAERADRVRNYQDA